MARVKIVLLVPLELEEYPEKRLQPGDRVFLERRRGEVFVSQGKATYASDFRESMLKPKEPAEPAKSSEPQKPSKPGASSEQK